MLWVRCSCEMASMMYLVPVVSGVTAEPSATATEMPAAHLKTSIPSVCRPLSGSMANRNTLYTIRRVRTDSRALLIQ